MRVPPTAFNYNLEQNGRRARGTSRLDDHAPGAVAGLDGRDDAVGIGVDHRNVVRQSVRGVESLAVGRERDAPRALADGYQRLKLHALDVENGDAVAAARGDVEAATVRRQRHALRLHLLRARAGQAHRADDRGV